jgi:predicted O-linked N-acetylglucosamine transferase (SPINDLY family)
MGVPVVTLIGVSFFERISYSNLSNVGLDDLCALTLDEYKAKVMELVENKERRRYLRSNLRMLIKQNPLGKAKDFAHDFGQTIKQILGRG